MKPLPALMLLIVTLGCGAQPTGAAQLRLEPVLLDVTTPTAAAVLTLHNGEDHEVTVQSRVFRWTQVDGADQLAATPDVVVSPPFVKLTPGADYTVRVVRSVKRTVAGEESYRVLVDELPEAVAGDGSGVNILVRQSVPVFFHAPRLIPADVSWSVRSDEDRLRIIADNRGDTRLRIASLRLRDSNGNIIDFGHGLVGYALGRSSIIFTATHVPAGYGTGGSIAIMSDTNRGPLLAAATLPTHP